MIMMLGQFSALTLTVIIFALMMNLAKCSGEFHLTIQQLQSVLQCPLVYKLCLREQQVTPSFDGDCSYGNVTLNMDSCNQGNKAEQCAINVTLVVPFDFSWTVGCIKQSFVKDKSMYSGSLVPQQPGLLVSYNSRTLQMSYRISVTCSPHYYSSSCSKLCRPRHDHFGHYNCDTQGDKICLQGWIGDNCQIALCRPGCHREHGSCDRPGECRCAFGWEGELCDKCRPYPGCKHGRCLDSPWQCVCDLQWGGILCDKDLNPCGRDIYPCQNGGVCENILPGQYRCACPPLYTGKHCQLPVSGCLSDGCLHGGTCVVMKTQAYCECTPGWTGPTCQQEENECASSPCHHGICLDRFNGFQCVCDSGWTGPLCEQDANECMKHVCMNALSCDNYVGGYTCVCMPGWTGVNCNMNIDDCIEDSCMNGGNCVDTIGGFLCICPHGFHGDQCETDIDECETSPCYHHGRCYNSPGSYHCMCYGGYTGTHCQVDLDPCNPNPCHQNSTCILVEDGHRCLCDRDDTESECTSLEIKLCEGRHCKHESSSECIMADQTYKNGERWLEDCNTCSCNNGQIVCTQLVCGPKNCVIHPNQLEAHTFCQENETCVLIENKICLSPPCLPWGECNHGNMTLITSVPAVHITMDVNTTYLPQGVFLESLCSAVRVLPALYNMSFHMILSVTCTMTPSQYYGNVLVIIGSQSTDDIAMVTEAADDIIQQILDTNNTILEAVMYIHVQQEVMTSVIYHSTWSLLLVIFCCIMALLGTITIFTLIAVYARCQAKIKHSTSQHQALLGQQNITITTKSRETRTISRYKNPLYDPKVDDSLLQLRVHNIKSNAYQFVQDMGKNNYDNISIKDDSLNNEIDITKNVSPTCIGEALYDFGDNYGNTYANIEDLDVKSHGSVTINQNNTEDINITLDVTHREVYRLNEL